MGGNKREREGERERGGERERERQKRNQVEESVLFLKGTADS